MSIKGDFISFSYNGVNSADLGVVRVTSSNRYDDNLLPTSKEKTVEVPGGNGTYFFGSYYTQRQIIINVAFDEVTENQIRLMRNLFGDKKPHALIFDDEPYKIFYAVSTGIPGLKYIPFSSPRVYKGEGSFTFTCYDPFAHCPYTCKYLDQWIYIYKKSKDVINSGVVPEYNDNHEIIGIKDTKYRLKTDLINWNKLGTFIVDTNLKYYLVIYYNSQNQQLNTDGRSGHSGWKAANTSFTIDDEYSDDLSQIKIVVSNYGNIEDEEYSTCIPITPSDLQYVDIRPINIFWYGPRYIKTNNVIYKTTEWNESAHLLNSNYGYDNNSNTTKNIFTLYNPGDVETDFELIIPFGSMSRVSSIQLQQNGVLKKKLEVSFSNISKKTIEGAGQSLHVCFNSKLNLIEELLRNDANGQYIRTGKIYNECITNGSWFKIPAMKTIYNDGWVPINEDSEWSMNIIVNDLQDFSRPTLNYDYLYY